MIAQGIPDIPVSIKNDVSRYTESRAASFGDWHPVKRNMIISTRFANVPQLHLVKMPLGARKQITFYEDAVTGATYEPVKGDYFLFTKDVGGNEFGQIYRYDVATGNVTMLTDGGRSQNGVTMGNGSLMNLQGVMEQTGIFISWILKILLQIKWCYNYPAEAGAF